MDEFHETKLHPRPDFIKKLVAVGDGGQGSFPEVFFRFDWEKNNQVIIEICSDRLTQLQVFENYIANVYYGSSNKIVELALWDTAGQEEYDRLRPLSYPESDVILICFAIDYPPSLENVTDKWYPEVTHFCPDIPIVLVGLKSDLRKNQNAIRLLRAQGLFPVTYQQAVAVADEIKAQYMECSSKENVESDFGNYVKILAKSYELWSTWVILEVSVYIKITIYIEIFTEFIIG
ncbi:hypothetical protein PMAC_002039 [Pneumocystis sp. 'macacae']|nr:hypothetical protein PMAC_002039 [Pneumocystis sp. 'macacae']